jgi:Holliday junction resolvasome RuvABC ATP-dependent DNA helicase subunit
MRSQIEIQRKLERLKVALNAHQTQMSGLGLQDLELLSLLQAEQHMLQIEIDTLAWVVGDSCEQTESAHRSRLDHSPVLDHLRVAPVR